MADIGRYLLKIEEWLARANEIREQLPTLTDPDAIATMEAVAKTYEDMATRMKALISKGE